MLVILRWCWCCCCCCARARACMRVCALGAFESLIHLAFELLDLALAPQLLPLDKGIFSIRARLELGSVDYNDGGRDCGLVLRTEPEADLGKNSTLAPGLTALPRTFHIFLSSSDFLRLFSTLSKYSCCAPLLRRRARIACCSASCASFSAFFSSLSPKKFQSLNARFCATTVVPRA